MKFFKKISAIAASALMIGMTAGVAAAANYPAPFVVGGTANVAIVYGTGTGVSSLDLVQAGNIQSNLQSYLSGVASTTTTVSGEAVELYTGGTKIYISDSINKVRSVLTKAHLPTLLADGSFSGNVDATSIQTIEIGNYPNITYEKQPTGDDDPNLAIKLSTSTSNPAFNLSVTFSKAINFSHADSEGEDITLFGQDFTIGAATDGTNLVLLKSTEKVTLYRRDPLDGSESATVTIAGKTYTVELTGASDTAATIKVTDETGASQSKEVNEAASKKIQGITIAVQTADESTNERMASIVAGAEKITLADNTNVKIGESDTAISGTDIDFAGGSPGAGLSKIVISVTADDSDKDAVKVGESFLDPAFGVVKLSLDGFNIAEDSTAREEIKITPSGDNRMEITFTNSFGDTKTIRYINYIITGAGTNASLYYDDNHHNISVTEREKMHKDDYLVVGNEDEGSLIKIQSVSKVSGSGTTASGDKLTFTDVFSGGSIDATLTANTSTISSGTVIIGGKSYNVYVEGAGGVVTDSYVYNVSLNYPDSAGDNIILFPTIQTSKGAKLAFYEPIVMNVTNWNSNGSSTTLVGGFLVPNGADAYQTIDVLAHLNSTTLTFDCAGTTKLLNGTATEAECNITNTGFGYNFSLTGLDTLTIQLKGVTGTTSVTDPAIMIFEEKDDNNVYEGLIVTAEFGSLSSTDPIGVNDVERTWLDDTLWDSITMASVNTIDKEIDLWGTIVSIDRGASSAKKATISYPDEQVYALVYIGEEASAVGVAGAAAGAQLGDILVKDTEINSVKSKNLVVVGGSCINSVAANLVGGAYCESSWTDATGVGSGEFLIQSFGDAYTTDRIALLVAGYNVADTVNAATYLRNVKPDIAEGKKYKGTTSTSAELVTTEV